MIVNFGLNISKITDKQINFTNFTKFTYKIDNFFRNIIFLFFYFLVYIDYR